jgi:modification methylase
MKSLNHESHEYGTVQMRSDWKLPLCTGKERLKINGEKAHPTQKPEALLERVIISSSNPGDIILDPFFGSGTTGAVAKKLGRHWVGIEADTGYISIAQQRIDSIPKKTECEESQSINLDNREKRIPFTALLQNGLIKEGQLLYFGQNGDHHAYVMADGHIRYTEYTGSIHKVGREIMNAPCNGWLAWYYIDEETGNREPLDRLRKKLRNEMDLASRIKNCVDGEEL